MSVVFTPHLGEIDIGGENSFFFNRSQLLEAHEPSSGKSYLQGSTNGVIFSDPSQGDIQ